MPRDDRPNRAHHGYTPQQMEDAHGAVLFTLQLAPGAVPLIRPDDDEAMHVLVQALAQTLAEYHSQPELVELARGLATGHNNVAVMLKLTPRLDPMTT